MKKLIQGIVEFRRNVQESYRESFGRLATGQAPDSLFIACSDSRVVPNTFASTNPGDLFVLRNMGNLIPPCGTNGVSTGDEAEAAAIEYSVDSLKVSDIIICGHSECAAMKAMLEGRDKVISPNLKNWLRHADISVRKLSSGATLNRTLTDHNQLSQLNVLMQLEHVKSYPAVHERLREGSLKVHGWWFDIAKADVYAYDEKINKFILIDEESSEQIIRSLDHQKTNAPSKK